MGSRFRPGNLAGMSLEYTPNQRLKATGGRRLRLIVRRRMHISRSVPVAIAALVLFPSVVRADGIDLVPYFSRVNYHGSVEGVIFLVALLMAVNYGLNFVFIGFPAMRLGRIPPRAMASDLVLLTVAGQLADRLGAFLATFAAEPVADLLHLHGEGAWAGPLIFLNFVLSGLAIAVLTLFFCWRRWHLAWRWTLLVMLLAAVFTNPAYALFSGWILP